VFAPLLPELGLADLDHGPGTSCGWADAQAFKGTGMRFHFLREFLLRIFSVFQTFTKYMHQVEFVILKVYPLEPELLANQLFLLTDVLGAVSDLLEHDLHHVHLTDGQASHLGQGLLNLIFVLGCL